jgi:cell wall-associated NlpC family hydrolase
VPRRGIRAGDILFFSGLGHVGIYVGHGRMVHAPHSGTRVQVVSLASNYGGRLVGARRLVR